MSLTSKSDWLKYNNKIQDHNENIKCLKMPVPLKNLRRFEPGTSSLITFKSSR